jgi:hypothetical protein
MKCSRIVSGAKVGRAVSSAPHSCRVLFIRGGATNRTKQNDFKSRSISGTWGFAGAWKLELGVCGIPRRSTRAFLYSWLHLPRGDSKMNISSTKLNTCGGGGRSFFAVRGRDVAPPMSARNFVPFAAFCKRLTPLVFFPLAIYVFFRG